MGKKELKSKVFYSDSDVCSFVNANSDIFVVSITSERYNFTVFYYDYKQK